MLLVDSTPRLLDTQTPSGKRNGHTTDPSAQEREWLDACPKTCHCQRTSGQGKLTTTRQKMQKQKLYNTTETYKKGKRIVNTNIKPIFACFYCILQLCFFCFFCHPQKKNMVAPSSGTHSNHTHNKYSQACGWLHPSQTIVKTHNRFGGMARSVAGSYSAQTL